MNATEHLTEPVAVPDVFVEGIGQIVKVPGDCFRFTLYATRDYGDGSPIERIIVAQLIWPREALLLALMQAAAAAEGQPFISADAPAMLPN